MTGSSLEVQENVALAPFTTLGIGGPARFFAEIRSEPELLAAAAFARENHLLLFPLGGGSNLLVPDSGFPGFVVHLTLNSPIETTQGRRNIDFRVVAGLEWDALVLHTCTLGLSGMECLAGIPGLVGGSPIQNIGAYGQEVSQTIVSVRAFDLQTGLFAHFSSEDCRFSYRTSVFNSSGRGRYIVTAVSFRLSTEARPNFTYPDLSKRFAGQQPTPLDIYHAVREIRRGKGMLITPGDPDCRSAGSFFKNPVISPERFKDLTRALHLEAAKIPHWATADAGMKVSAAWLVEQAGFPRGFSVGDAGISSRHSLALTNRGHATYAELTRLRDLIRTGVRTKFQIWLEQEPVEPTA